MDNAGTVHVVYGFCAGAFPGFSKGGGKEPARSTGFEPNAASGEQRVVSGEDFVLNYALNQ